MLSERAKNLKPSATLALNAKAQELAKAGRDVISFAVGEPDWDTFDYIKKAAHDALDAGFTKYTPASGISDLKSAVVDKIKSELGLSYESNQCMVALGAKQAIFNALQVLCNPGDEVIVPAPYWVSYPTMIELADAKPVIPVCPKETQFKLTPDLLKRTLTAKTKAIILNSPNNPTGQVYSIQELKNIAAVLELTGVWVISDDIYDKMIFTGESIAPHIAQQSEKLRNQVLLVNSVSKTYSMTGWRLGSIVGDKRVIDACSNYQSQSASCAVGFAQKGAVAALNGPNDQVGKAMAELANRKRAAMEALHGISSLDVLDPMGAFYIWVNISKLFGKTSPSRKEIHNSTDFSTALLEDQGVAVVPGIEFGTEGFIRMSYTLAMKKMLDGLGRLKKFVESLE